MSDAVKIAIVSGIVAVIGALFSFLAIYVTLIVGRKVDGVHQVVNSRMDEMLRITRAASKAEGVLEEKEKRLPDEREPDVATD